VKVVKKTTIMKTTLLSLIAALVIAGCGNATDGDAKTDTTNLRIDTGGLDAVNDTAQHVNTNSGQYPGDTMAEKVPGDLRSSSPTKRESRNTTPQGDSVH
jgi:ABC-type glycerol-3-phosphate transport system substrate-binding protein